MGITVANASVGAVDNQLDAIPLGSGTGLFDCIRLGFGEPGNASTIFAPPGPSVAMGNHMNRLGHIQSSCLSLSALTQGRLADTLWRSPKTKRSPLCASPARGCSGAARRCWFRPGIGVSVLDIDLSIGLNARLTNLQVNIHSVNTMKHAENSPFPARLKQARQMCGLSLRELAEKIDDAVSYAALSKYEHGVMQPSSGVLIALSQALSQSPDFFFRPFRLELTGVRFRKKSLLGASAEKAFLERARDHFERYQELEELVGDVRRFEPPFEGVSVATQEDAEELAKKLREKWRLGMDPLPNIQELLEENGIKVFELQTDDKHFDGLKADTETGPVVVLASWLKGNLPRMRLTEVHELAHIVLPVGNGISEAEEEKLANRFAGAFLLPEDAFRNAFGKHRHQLGIGELIEMKRTFGASIMAIMKRAEHLGLISAPIYKRFCMYANEQRWRTTGEPGDELYARQEGSGRFRRLVLRAVAEDVISVSAGAEHLGIGLHEMRQELKTVIA